MEHERRHDVAHSRPSGRGRTPPRASALPGEALRGNAESALHHLVTAASTLFSADGVGVMLLGEDGALRWVTASSPRAVAYEKTQADLREGPCLDALRRRAPMWTSDVSADARWPSLGAVAERLGVRAALCAPVELEARAVGTFNVFLDAPLAWTQPPSLTMLSDLCDNVRRAINLEDFGPKKAVVNAFVQYIEVRSRSEIYPTFRVPTAADIYDVDTKVRMPVDLVGATGIEPVTSAV